MSFWIKEKLGDIDGISKKKVGIFHVTEEEQITQAKFLLL